MRGSTGPRTVCLEKPVEDVRLIAWGDAWSVIDHADHQGLLFPVRPQPDVTTVGREFYGIVYQVANYLKLYPPKEKISLVGYDLVEESKPHINSGLIDFAISQRSELQGYESIYSLFKHVVLHSKIPEKIIVPLDIVTKENVGYYYD